jgi:hypothetical protein
MGKWPTHTVLHLLCFSRSVTTNSCLLCALQSFLTCFFGVWKKLKYSSGWFALPFISPLTDLDHNSPHVSSMCIIYSTVLHVQQPLSSYTLYLSVGYSFNREFKQNYMILTVDWLRHITIVIVILVLTTLKMTIWVAKKCQWLLYNWFGLFWFGFVWFVLFAHPLSHTMDTSITVYNLYIKTQLKI